jgi:hypothetical protein
MQSTLIGSTWNEANVSTKIVRIRKNHGKFSLLTRQRNTTSLKYCTYSYAKS